MNNLHIIVTLNEMTLFNNQGFDGLEFARGSLADGITVYIYCHLRAIVGRAGLFM